GDVGVSSMPVLLFALGVSVLTGVIFGVAPAWMTSNAEPVEALRGANREVGGGRHWAQKALVVVQAAVSLVLLRAAAMLGGSLRNLEHQNFGFDPDGRYLVSISSLLQGNYKQKQLVPLFREMKNYGAYDHNEPVSEMLRAQSVNGLELANASIE